jgi:uncharacterized phage protein (TIGR02220 family)
VAHFGPSFKEVTNKKCVQRMGQRGQEEERLLNYYPHHIGDYTRDTAHLSMLEDAAYRRMLDVYYRTESPLPKDQHAIYRLVRATTRQEKLAVDIVIGEFFTESPDGWRNKRADEEILISKEKSAKAAESANMRWHRPSNANAMRTQCEGNAPNNQEPITNNQRTKGNVGLKPDALRVLNFLNQKTGRSYEPVEANIKPIAARLREGATVDDLRAVVAKKCREWAGDEKMDVYLRPKTLFNATNFANYKGELSAPEPERKVAL